MPNLANKEFFERVLPCQTSVKAWLHAVSDALGIDYLTTEYFYLDKRAKHLSSTHLQRIRARNQKVRSDLNQLRKHQGDVYARTFSKDRQDNEGRA